MKKEFLFIFFLFLLPASQFLKAQSDSLNKKFIRLNSLSIGIGPNFNQPGYVSIDTYKKIAPQDSLVNCDLSPYNRSKAGGGVGTYFTAIFGFNRLNKKTNQYYKQREHRIGFKFYSNDLLQLKYDKSTKTNIDTFLYKGTPHYGMEIDSNTNFYYAVQRQNVMLEFGTIYLSSATRLTTGYVGYNLGLGFSYGGNSHAEYSESIYYKDKKHLYDYAPGPSKVENTILNNSVVGYASLNWGVNFRFAKTKRFWSKLIFNTEFRAGWTGEYIQNYGNYIHATLGGHFGFKFLL